MKYTIELTEKQMRLMVKALEQHSRMICGQLDTRTISAIDHTLDKVQHKENDNWDKYIENRNKIDEHLFEIKKLMFEGTEMGTDDWRHGNHGVGWDNEADMAYEMYKMMLYQFEKERMEKEGNEYFGNVHSSEPLHYSDQPLIKVSAKSDRELKLQRIVGDEEI
jgi:hypothetical protein